MVDLGWYTLNHNPRTPQSLDHGHIYCVYLFVLVAVILWLSCSVDISLSCDFALLSLLSISRAHSPSLTLAFTVRLLFLQPYFYLSVSTTHFKSVQMFHVHQCICLLYENTPLLPTHRWQWYSGEASLCAISWCICFLSPRSTYTHTHTHKYKHAPTHTRTHTLTHTHTQHDCC